MRTEKLFHFAVFLLLGAIIFSNEPTLAQSLASVRDTHQQSGDGNPPVSGERESSRASSSQWHTYLWESLPMDWLQEPTQAVLLQAYEANEWKPFFITAHFRVDKRAQVLLDRLSTAENEAVDPRPFKLADLRSDMESLERLRLSMQALDPGFRDTVADSQEPPSLSGRVQQAAGSPGQQGAEAQRSAGADSVKTGETEKLYHDLFQLSSAVDIRLAHNLMVYANTMNPFSKELQVHALSGQIPMAEFFKGLEPPSPGYESLVRAWHKYQKLAAQFPRQPSLPAQKLSPGDSGNSIRELQRRLQEEDFYHGKISGHFDEATREAVQRFQLFHNLNTDGKVGQQTREWLNISFREKADMIAQALKLYRQSPTRRYQKFVRVNIPQFTLEYHNDGKIAATHRVIVGKASGKKIKLNGRSVGENQTPTLNSVIEQVVINPRWYVSDRIRLELNDAIAADPNYLARNGYIYMTSSNYPWGEPRLIQLPGPNNALGRVRFDFPNPYAVYMHDTPNKNLFQRTRRDFSHGCIRVEKAHELARELLAAEQNPAASRTEAYLSSNRETFLKLRDPIPIIIEYLPVAVDFKGDLVFYGDPYGWFRENSSGKS